MRSGLPGTSPCGESLGAVALWVESDGVLSVGSEARDLHGYADLPRDAPEEVPQFVGKRGAARGAYSLAGPFAELRPGGEIFVLRPDRPEILGHGGGALGGGGEVQLGDGKPREVVKGGGVPEEGEVDPAATTGSSRRGAVLAAGPAEELPEFAALLGGERSGSDARRIRFRHSDHG